MGIWELVQPWRGPWRLSLRSSGMEGLSLDKREKWDEVTPCRCGVGMGTKESTVGMT